ncbi:DUF1049 domain-containing protein [Rhodobacterales bacterium]|nr:DUF1049 domain-containing protein [Rhodobacterales bacterium]
MVRFVINVILFVIAVIVVSLAVANRHPVSIAFNPFDPQDPRLTLTGTPLFWVIFASIVIGIILGGCGAWITQGRWRKEARVKRREAAKWHKEAEQVREMQASAERKAQQLSAAKAIPQQR